MSRREKLLRPKNTTKTQQSHSDPQLQSCWQAVQPNKDQQYISQQKVVQWMIQVLTLKNTIKDHNDESIKAQLHVYMKQVCGIDQNQVHNVSFKFKEVTTFYQWFLKKQQSSKQIEGKDPNKQIGQVQNEQKKEEQNEQDNNNKKKDLKEQLWDQQANMTKQINSGIQKFKQQRAQKKKLKIMRNAKKQQQVMNQSGEIQNQQEEQQKDQGQQEEAPLENQPEKQELNKNLSKQKQKDKLKLSLQNSEQQNNGQQANKHKKKKLKITKSKQNLHQQLKLQQEQNYLYPADQKQKQKQPQQQQQTEQKQQPKDTQNNEHQNQFGTQMEANNNQNNKDQQQNLTGKNYREYLLAIYQHYCRVSYATGSDPTFQQIQQKTQSMTINKFMIFCKDFGIAKLNNLNRNSLIEMFRKNSQFFKQMSFDQFIAVLVKISHTVYSSQNQNQPSQNSKEFQQFLLFLQVNNFSSFKKKAQSLNIPYKPKGNNNQNLNKKPSNNVKPKYNVSTSKNQQQVKKQLEQRKRIRSQNKLKALENFNKRNISTKKIAKHPNQQKQQNSNKKLPPPIPPARKSSNSTNKNAVVDPFVGVTGYANIHKLKLMGKQGHVQSKLKLNNVVEQAKRILQYHRNQQAASQFQIGSRVSSHGRQTPYSYFSNHKNLQQILDRQMSHSSNGHHSQRDLDIGYQMIRKSYAPHGHSQLQKRQITKQQNEDLKGIIDNQDDQDEFLQEHLNRQKKSGLINQRIQKKIKQYSQNV